LKGRKHLIYGVLRAGKAPFSPPPPPHEDHVVNIRGLRGRDKKISLQRPIEEDWLEIVLIQESMVASDSFILEFEKFLSGWVFFVVDSVGNSSGRIRGWSLQRKLLNSFSIFSGLLTKVFSLELD
jgi:hypothetical protein